MDKNRVSHLAALVLINFMITDNDLLQFFNYLITEINVFFADLLSLESEPFLSLLRPIVADRKNDETFYNLY